MSKEIIKQLAKCPLCGGEIKQVFMNKKTYESAVWDESVGNVETWFRCYGCDSEFYHYEPIDIPEKQIEWWNTRKPLERIVKRLKKELLESLNKANDEMIDNGHTLDFEHYFGEKESYEKAIEILKEEGGMNE